MLISLFLLFSPLASAAVLSSSFITMIKEIDIIPRCRSYRTVKRSQSESVRHKVY